MIDLQQLDRAYKEVFASPAGQMILDDLRGLCKMDEVITPDMPDREVLKYREMQNVFNYIVGDKYIPDET